MKYNTTQHMNNNVILKIDFFLNFIYNPNVQNCRNRLSTSGFQFKIVSKTSLTTETKTF